ncbi:LysE family translocator [Paracoccus rhizosphaerae]|uniref:LysE family translocator n=1 Tax=Paracoccus rhizosphaerae TaxID=1133347 RepID=A0ABV6CE59_9RHOB|nr:LysE family translocator [Paracoccus rhizosphaerae]
MTPEFLLTTLLIVASPGTGAIYTIAAGLTAGPRASLVAALGCTLGIIPHMLAAISGLAALMTTNPAAFEIVRYLGMAYLLFMAWSMFRARGALPFDGRATGAGIGKVIMTSILINLLNPKLSLFFLAFLPQFVSPNEPRGLTRMITLSLVFMALTFIVFAAYGAGAAFMRRHVLSSLPVQIWMRRGFALAFAGLAVQLALTLR